MRNRLINLHTSGETKPIGLLNPGEIAIQHSTPENSRIYIDTATDSTSSSEDTIVEFVPKSYMDKEIQRVMELIGNSSGDTGNTGSTIDKSDYICDDPNANPIIVEASISFKFDSGITEITPCTYDFSQITNLEENFEMPSNLTKITANMESLASTRINVDSVEYSSFYNCKDSLTEANLYLPNLFDGEGMFQACSSLTSFTTDLSSLTSGYHMFSSCSGLTSWNISLPKLIYGGYMFYYCRKLTSWNIPLPKLINAKYMFYYCTGLTSFTSDLSSLTSGDSMFYECSLRSWDIPLPKLMDGDSMFSGNSLTSFTSDLSSLKSGYRMFYQNRNLKNFASNLSSLLYSDSMFYNCSGLTNVVLSGTLNCNRLAFSNSSKLTVDSMVNIINALVDRTGQNNYTIYLGSTNLAKLTDEQKAVATNKNWTLM